MKIVVGSNNPVKIKAVRVVCELVWPECEVIGKEVASGVAAQPRSETETRRGAVNRAKLAVVGAEMGVGLEGGVTAIDDKLFECAWVAIVGKDGRVGLGGGLYFELPEKVAKRIRAGEELGPIMEELMQYDVKRKEGAIGVLTKGLLTRQAAYEQIIKSALVRFVSKEWFN